MTERDGGTDGRSRRNFLLGAAGVASLGVLGGGSALALPRLGPNGAFDFGQLDGDICKTAVQTVATGGPLKKIQFAWNAGAPCLVGVTTAKEKGFFEKHGLDVDLVNYSGSTDQLLETLATGKADAAVGMALRWLKPLEQGFDVKIITATHGGCLRLLVPTAGTLKSLADLKGKVIAVSDQNSPAKNFFSIDLKKAGVDPTTDVEFRQFPGPLLRAAVEKGEAHAIADSDPNTYLWLKDGQFTELSSNLAGQYSDRACCVVGVGGKIVREDKATATAIARALIEAAEFAHHNPAEAAATYVPFAAGKISVEDLTELAKYHTHHQHPAGAELKRQLALYADELKLVNVIKPTTDTAKYAERIYADVLS